MRPLRSTPRTTGRWWGLRCCWCATRPRPRKSSRTHSSPCTATGAGSGTAARHYGIYEDLLRGALHAAVDSAEPAGDGLERIRARLTTPHPLPVAWLMAVCSWVARRARGSLDSVSAWLQTVPGEVHRRGGAAEGR